nr:hypothetical protein [Roseibacterium elongatum]
MDQRFLTDRAIERRVGTWQGVKIAQFDGDLFRKPRRGKCLARRRHTQGRDVETLRNAPAPGQRDQSAAIATGDIEHPRSAAEPGEVEQMPRHRARCLGHADIIAIIKPDVNVGAPPKAPIERRHIAVVVIGRRGLGVGA